MPRHGRPTKFPPVYSNGVYRLGDDVIRPDGDKWLAFAKDRQVGERHDTREDAWRAVQRFAIEEHERRRVEEWKRLGGGA